LAAPADDYVAGFIGQDGTLKRLALLRVADVPVAYPAPDPRLPQVAAEASLREALDLMLAHGTDRCSAPSGVLTYAGLCAAVGPAPETAPETVAAGDR
ncbi:MAG: glycine/betaine ABC transporter permease, partial [Nonomuraea sp.]|nr:glycine/betaine ABC transporter permease [Nonomuraea sp.]